MNRYKYMVSQRQSYSWPLDIRKAQLWRLKNINQFRAGIPKILEIVDSWKGSGWQWKHPSEEYPQSTIPTTTLLRLYEPL